MKDVKNTKESRADRARKLGRLSCDCPLSLAAPATYGRIFLDEQENDQEYQRAWLADLSQTGVGLVMIRSVPVNALIHILLRTSTTHQLMHLQGEVAHATLQASGEWLIGCRLSRALTVDELDELLE